MTSTCQFNIVKQFKKTSVDLQALVARLEVHRSFLPVVQLLRTQAKVIVVVKKAL